MEPERAGLDSMSVMARDNPTISGVYVLITRAILIVQVDRLIETGRDAPDHFSSAISIVNTTLTC